MSKPAILLNLFELAIYGQHLLFPGLNMTSHAVDYITSQINDIRTLYGYLFPNNIRLIVKQGDEPYWGTHE